MNLTVLTLGEIAKQVGGVIQTGPFGSQLHSSDYREEGTPVIMPQDIIDDRIVTTSIARIDDQMVQKLARHQLKVGDIIFPRRGELNKRAIITEEQEGWLCGTGCVKISIAGGELNPYYLFYYLKQPQVVKWIENKAVGATMLNLNTGILQSLEVSYPPLTLQNRVADILSAYDDLIANNNRRMALLEESIHLLYQEWFVRLRFPGYERVEIVDGVPEGWEKVPLKNLLAFHTGGGWGAEDLDAIHTNPAFVIRGTDINTVNRGDISGVPFRYHQETNLKSRRLTDGDLVFEVSGGSKTQGVGRVLRVTQKLLNLFSDDVMCASFCKLLRLHSRDLVEYLFLYLCYCRETGLLTQYESQSASNIINFKFTNFINSLQVLLPPAKLLEEFNLLGRPIFEQVGKLGIQNVRLREARDLLLPRLMNGEIRV